MGQTNAGRGSSFGLPGWNPTAISLDNLTWLHGLHVPHWAMNIEQWPGKKATVTLTNTETFDDTSDNPDVATFVEAKAKTINRAWLLAIIKARISDLEKE